MYTYVNSTTQRCPNKIIKIFQLEGFFPFAAGVNDTGGKPWAANISANFRKNSKRPEWYNQKLGRNWFKKKTRSKKLLLVFFMNQFPPPPQSIPYRMFRILSKSRGDIRESRCTTGINNTGGKIAAGINDTGGKFATSISDTGGKFLHHFLLRCWYQWQICHRCQRYRRQICHRCQRHRWQIATGINNTGGKFFHRCRWHRWQTLSCEYLREISKKFDTILMVKSEAWGKLIQEKNQKQKISWHCPFKGTVSRDFL